jgi:hypothetical protein
LISWLIVFEPVRHSTDLTTLEGAVTLAYPLGDVVIVFLVVLLVRGTTRAYRLNLWCLLAGLLALSFSDAVYSYLANVKHFSSGGLIDTGWFVGYLAIALSARFSLTQSAAARRSQATPALTNAAVLVPFLPMLAALTLAAIMIQLGHHLDRVTLITAFTLVGCVLARQALLMLDFAARRRVQNNPTDPLATDQPADTLSAATAA